MLSSELTVSGWETKRAREFFLQGDEDHFATKLFYEHTMSMPAALIFCDSLRAAARNSGFAANLIISYVEGLRVASKPVKTQHCPG